MLVQPLTNSDGMMRGISGDVIDCREVQATLTTAGAGTILGSMFATPILRRSGPGAGYTDTSDTAANIIAALCGAGGLNATGVTFEDIYQPANTPTPGATWRWLYINTVAQAMTAAAGTGVTLGTNVNVAASNWREYLLTLTNTTAPTQFTATTVNSSPTVTPGDVRNLRRITPGMLVSGTGISGGTTVSAVGPSTFTLSANATASGTVVLTFNPTLTWAGLRSGAL